MPTGKYNANGCPTITATLFRLPLPYPVTTEFVIDSGADETVLSRQAAIQSGLAGTATDADGNPELAFPREMNVSSEETHGVGGSAPIYVYEDPLEIGFTERDSNGDAETLHVEKLSDLRMSPTCPASLLGRDILNRFDITFSHADQRVDFDRRQVMQDSYTRRPL